MKLSSKSILSPSHNREPPQMSLSSSFNRRLVTNGSIKGAGQASPMFPSVGRKRVSGFENHEPSSPKVTCIGQVRVKTKKQGKKMRARSKRRGEEASFRKTQQNNFQVGVNPDLSRQKSHEKSQSFQYQNQNQQQNLQQRQECSHRNQRWVHLPLTICEALKGFGAEFNCFFPCRSSCTREKEVKTEEAGGEEGRRSRWVVTVQGGDVDTKGREVELVMGEEEAEEEDTTTERRHRRHVFEDIDIEKLKNENFEEKEEEKARVSICIPPKNALLLMRCRSDPVKMAALANRFWEPTIQKEGEEEEEEGEEEQAPMEEDKEVRNTIHESEKGVAFMDLKEAEAVEATNLETNEVDEGNKEEAKAEEEEDEDANANEQDGNFSGATFAAEKNDEEKAKAEENDVTESSELSSTCAVPAPSEESEPHSNELSAKGSTQEEEKGTKEEEEKESKERENGSNLERESGSLPECLLLMMCEPKLSMEVSRETWVCTADFIRWLPPRPAGKTGGIDRQPNQPKKKVAVDSKPPQAPAPPQLIQPARSSCSFPATAGMSAAGSNGYEPFVLTRCKSEPRESPAAKLAPEACFWNNRKLLEPHPPAQLRLGAAGVGF